MEKFELVVNGEEVTFTGEQIIEAVRAIMSKHMYFNLEEDGTYSHDIYVEHGDGLNDDNIKAVSKADNKMEAFCESMDDYVLQCTDYEEDNFTSTLIQHWDDETYGEYHEYEDFIREWMHENVCFNFPYDHYLKQSVQVNIVVDAGDGNYDFTLNNFFSYNGDGEIDEDMEAESAILWLVRQQGYTVQDLLNAYDEGRGTDNNFLASIVQELVNVTTHMNALTFFVEMSIEDYIKLGEATEYIKIDKAVNVGLLDVWNGAGSVLEIALEHDVELPIKFAEPHIDGHRGYGADEIYGLYSRHWKDSVLEYK